MGFVIIFYLLSCLLTPTLGHENHEIKCWPKAKNLGDSCHHLEECQEIDSNAECQFYNYNNNKKKRICQCSPPYRLHQNECIQTYCNASLYGANPKQIDQLDCPLTTYCSNQNSNQSLIDFDDPTRGICRKVTLWPSYMDLCYKCKVCGPGFELTIDGEYCLKIMSCSSSHECHSEGEQICINGRCRCPNGTYVQNGKRQCIVKKVNLPFMVCETSAQDICDDMPNTKIEYDPVDCAIGPICRCDDGFVPSENYTVCVKPSSKLSDSNQNIDINDRSQSIEITLPYCITSSTTFLISTNPVLRFPQNRLVQFLMEIYENDHFKFNIFLALIICIFILFIYCIFRFGYRYCLRLWYKRKQTKFPKLIVKLPTEDSKHIFEKNEFYKNKTMFV